MSFDVSCLECTCSSTGSASASRQAVVMEEEEDQCVLMRVHTIILLTTLNWTVLGSVGDVSLLAVHLHHVVVVVVVAVVVVRY